ncbi:MAG: precorrin-6Y C5,15-methyltransferase (decarboxylating) subunit CbiT [Methanopyraceae archaeon]
MSTEGVPGPTKPPAKSVIISMLRPRPGDRVLEVGAGSGSITLELAKCVGPWGEVIAVERDERALRSLRSNLRDFCALDRVRVIEGEAPDALEDVGEVDAALVSGSDRLGELLEDLRTRVRDRILLNSVLPETFARASERLRGWRVDSLCLVWGEGRRVTRGTLFSGMRTLFLALFTRRGER